MAGKPPFENFPSNLLFPLFSIDGIPRIIVTCIQMVDRDGLKETGIYRVCCITSDLQRLRHQFDRNYHGGEEMLAEKNVHVAANLLKLFFRELYLMKRTEKKEEENNQ